MSDDINVPTINEVTETSSDATTTPLVDAETLDATQNLIIRLTQQLDDLLKKQRDLRDMIKNIFDNDETLQKAEKLAETQTKEARKRKNELAQSGQSIELKSKITDLTEDIKMVQESLNTHLLNYYQLTGSQTVDFPDGLEREMVIRAKLKKPQQKRD